MLLGRRTVLRAAAPTAVATASAVLGARPAMAANTAYVMAYFTESPSSKGPTTVCAWRSAATV